MASSSCGLRHAIAQETAVPHVCCARKFGLPQHAAHIQLQVLGVFRDRFQ